MNIDCDLSGTLPSDEKSIHITSHWAGGHHVSHAGKDKRQQGEASTYTTLASRLMKE